ncbi:MAG: group II intron reverse transcriptase/maturase, partial [Planctomycetaceae bacterium]|nr:group II intron reverse transcriptase/maturase [Planctomycetaceae bacterium]
MLRRSFYALKRDAAPGVDGVRWREYATGAAEKLSDLHGRVHRGAYRAMASRRTWIPKADGSQRPLGIAALEDKIVQHAVVTILNEIYEVDFKGFSYGFRRGRHQHMALDALNVGLQRRKVNWVLDIDIRKYFDRVSQGWLERFIEHRIADRRVLRLIRKWLKAGVIEDGEWSTTEEGTAQGAVISPLLANVYLHYVFDQWVDKWRKSAAGDVIVVRYADDAIIGFQQWETAQRFLEELKERLAKFGLELNEDKTRLIEFGRFARVKRKRRGVGKPETFTFLGLRHVCAEVGEGGFIVVRITDGKRKRKKLAEIKLELRRRMHEPISATGEPGDARAVPARGGAHVVADVTPPQRQAPAELEVDAADPRPVATDLEGGTSDSQRAVRRQNPRQEPSALTGRARICAGGGRRRPSLPRTPDHARPVRLCRFGTKLAPAHDACYGRGKCGSFC